MTFGIGWRLFWLSQLLECYEKSCGAQGSLTTDNYLAKSPVTLFPDVPKVTLRWNTWARSITMYGLDWGGEAMARVPQWAVCYH